METEELLQGDGFRPLRDVLECLIGWSKQSELACDIKIILSITTTFAEELPS